MRLTFMLLLTFFSLQNVSAGKGDLVNNGGGLAEKNILYAYQKLERYIQMCLNSSLCRLDGRQREILTQIQQGLPQEKQAGNQIQFASERNSPGTFIIDREVKVAKTGSRIGSPIIVNTDLLYSRNEMGFYIPVSVAESVAILIHELGHHYGNYSHTELDLLGVRMAMMLQLKTYNTPLLPWSSQVSATIINAHNEDGYPDVVLYVEDQAVDLTEAFYKAVFCTEFAIPVPILPLPDITLDRSRPRGTIFHNVRWDKFDAQRDDSFDLTIIGDLSHKCKDQKNIIFRSQDYRAKIKFNVSRSADGRWSLNSRSIDVKQTKDPWWKIIKFN